MKSHRTLTPELKLQVVIETLQGDKKQSEIARQYGIHPQLIVGWKRFFLREGVKIFVSKREGKQKDQKVEELEKIIGRQTIEIQFLKKVLGQLG